MADVLLTLKRTARYTGEFDFVFVRTCGALPWPHGILTDHLKPAAEAAKIGRTGWHTFRHTYPTLPHALGTTPAVQKELLRHADIQTTLNIYKQAVTAEKREAASKVVRALWKA